MWRLRALRATAMALGRRGASDDAIDAWWSLVRCPGELETGAQRRVVAEGWLRLASALDTAGRIDEEITALQALRRRFPHDSDREVVRLVAGARLPLAVALLASGRVADADALTGELVSELGSATGERLEALAGHVVALSAAFAKHERYERAGQLCEAVLARVDAVDEPWAPSHGSPRGSVWGSRAPAE